jgi:hypothetical protein
MSWLPKNGNTDEGAMPVNVSERTRATVTAGLAKLVDDVKKCALPMNAPMANAAAPGLDERSTPNATRIKPEVATTSPSKRPPPGRLSCDSSTAGSENMRFAMAAPAIAPATCARTWASASAVDKPPSRRSARVMTGFRCAPETGVTARMMAITASAAAEAFSKS